MKFNLIEEIMISEFYKLLKYYKLNFNKSFNVKTIFYNEYFK